MEQDFTDSVYIIEGITIIQSIPIIFMYVSEILGTRKCRNSVEYHIKWEDYDETTW